MKYNKCSSCIFLHPEIKDEKEITPKHCMCKELESVFGKQYGFPTGIDIVCCDFYRSPSTGVCDVVYSISNRRVGYIIPSARPKCRLGAGSLPDNSKNIHQKVLSL